MRHFRSLRIIAALLSLSQVLPAACTGTLYLTIDTGWMSQAQNIVAVLGKHKVRATFFAANEPTINGDKSLEPRWAPFWKTVAAQGHEFGSHTWRHGKILADRDHDHVSYLVAGKASMLTRKEFCEELNRSRDALLQLTGKQMADLWRAPGGHTSPNAIKFAKSCGYQHVGWTDAGFLGDELPSQQYPNSMLLKRAVNHLKSGDVMLLHLGIRSRKDPFAPMLDPLLTALQKKGFCFDTISAKAEATR